MTDTLDQTAQQIAAAGREALLARLRPAFERAAAAHADILEIPPDRLEQMIRDAADRADGLQWRRALAGVAVDQLGLDLGEALRHPAVARAQELLGAPSYEDAFRGGDASPGSRPSGGDRPAATAGASPGLAGYVTEPEAEAPPAAPAAEIPSAGLEDAGTSWATGAEAPAEPSELPSPEEPSAPVGGSPSPAETAPASSRPYWELAEEDPYTAPTEAAPSWAQEAEAGSPAESLDAPYPSDYAAEAAPPAPPPEPPAPEVPEPAAAESSAGSIPEPVTRTFPAPGADPSTVHVPAVHLGGIANLAAGESGLELRFADPGLDIAREDDAVLGRIAWEEIRSVEVAPPGRLRRRRGQPEAKLVIRTERGDASFRIPGAEEQELRRQLGPALTRLPPQA